MTGRTQEEAPAPPAAPATRGRPRVAATRLLVIEAFLNLVAQQGYVATSMDQVAERAGVSKSTIYRRWPSKDDLALEAHEALMDTSDVPDTGSLEGDLHALVQRSMSTLGGPRESRVMQASIGEMLGNEPLARAFREGVLEHRIGLIGRIFERAIARGEVAPDTDWRSLAYALIGAHVFRVAIMGEPSDAAASARLVRAIARAAAARDEGDEAGAASR